MKVFNFIRIEYHTVERYYDAQVTEDEIKKVLAEADIPKEQFAEYINGIEEQNHPKHNEAIALLVDSNLLQDKWEYGEDIFASIEDGSFDVDIGLESIDDSDYFGNIDSQYTRRLH